MLRNKLFTLLDPAYHMNKTNWVSTLLSGPLPAQELQDLLTLCYDAVAPKRRPRR